MNFGLANTIVQERAPGAFARPHLRRFRSQFLRTDADRWPADCPVLSDLIGMRTALAVSAITFGIGAFFILNAAGRHVCDEPASPRVTEPEPSGRSRSRNCRMISFSTCWNSGRHTGRRCNAARDQRYPWLRARRTRSWHSHLPHARHPGDVRCRRNQVQQPAQLLSAARRSDARFARLLSIFRVPIRKNASGR